MNTANNTKNKINQKKKNAPKKKNTQTQDKKPRKKLTRAEYDDLRQIDWIPFDPYAD